MLLGEPTSAEAGPPARSTLEHELTTASGTPILVSESEVVAQSRRGMADVLARTVETAAEIERWLDGAADEGEAWSLLRAWLSNTPEDYSSRKAVLKEDPTRIGRITCVLLLRKARLHTLAVRRANETNNVHSLAVQMRPVLECAGQVVFIFHNLIIAPNLTIEPERAVNVVGGYLNADYYRTIIGITKGTVGHEQLLKTISAASALSGMSKEEVLGGRSLRQEDKVAALEGGKAWLCLLFIHPGAPNLISLRSAGTMPA